MNTKILKEITQSLSKQSNTQRELNIQDGNDTDTYIPN